MKVDFSIVCWKPAFAEQGSGLLHSLQGLTCSTLTAKGPGLNFFHPGATRFLEPLPTFSWDGPSKPEEQAAVLFLCLWKGTQGVTD